VNFAELSQRLSRADFLEGLGIYVGPTEAAFVHLDKRFFQVRVRDYAVVPLPGPDRAAERPQALAQAVAEFAKAHGVDTRRTVLCLPRTDAAFSRAQLPAAARENLEQVLEYELENLIPLPRDQVFFDFAVRATDEERIQILLMCVPRAIVQGYLDALEGVGVRPRAIGLASTAIVDYLAFCTGQPEAPLSLLLGTQDAAEFAVVKERRVIGSHLVFLGRQGSEGVLTRSMARELAEAAAGDDVPLYRWALANGAGPPLPEIGEADLLSLAHDRLEASPAFFAETSPVVLPALGAALGAIREGSVDINLLPRENRLGIESGIGLTTVVLVGLFALLLVGWGASGMVKDHLLLREVQNRIAEMAPQVAEGKKLQEEIADLERQVGILTQGQDSHVTVLLKEVTAAVPSDAYLTSVNIRNGVMTLDGQATKASDLIQQLEKSKSFKGVAFTSPTTRTGDKERFSLKAEIEK
jgi:Tfp pilus assembly protein PilN